MIFPLTYLPSIKLQIVLKAYLLKLILEKKKWKLCYLFLIQAYYIMRHLEDVVNPRSEKCKTGEDIPNMLKY